MNRFKAWLRRWLGIEHDRALHDGLRRDFEKVGTHHAERLKQIIEQLNRTTNAAMSANDRVNTYERTVPAIAKVKRAIDDRQARLTAAAKANGNGTHAEATPE